jgi:GT2 family glycosyltransferase
VGARFDWHKGALRRLNDDELNGAVDVDYVGSGHVAMYRVSALMDVGVFCGELFFGHTEVEFGLRLRRAGYRIVANGELWKNRREASGRIGIELRPGRQSEVSWRRYYVIRNHIYMMQRFGRWDLALKHALVQVLAKPAYTLAGNPRLAVRGFWQGLRASWDGWFGRMGKRREPEGK